MKAHAIFYLTTFSFLEIYGFLLPQNRLVITRNAYSICTTVAATAATCPSSPSNSFIGSALTDIQLAFEAVGNFFDRIEGVQFEQTSGGVNNSGCRSAFYMDGTTSCAYITMVSITQACSTSIPSCYN